MTGLSKPTIVKWFSILRDVCSQRLLDHPIQIGGIGEVVEIDESLVSRRKYNIGHAVPQRWVFGGVNPVTNIGFLQFVPDRSAATLLPIIQQRIAAGTTIISDQWAPYSNVANIPVVPPYDHRTVNHSEEFVNSHGDTTNHIEAMWNNAKRKLKKMCGTTTDMLPGYLDTFMWKQQYGKTADMCFDSILLHISERYPV